MKGKQQQPKHGGGLPPPPSHPKSGMIMEFKSKEELIKDSNKEHCIIDEPELAAHFEGLNQGIEEGIEIAFKSFAKRKEFYKKYRSSNSPHDETWDKLVKLYGEYLRDKGAKLKDSGEILMYWDWLHDEICFKDVK